MKFKLNYNNRLGVNVEETFVFKNLDNQFKITKIFSAVNKKFPTFFKNKDNENNPEITDGILFCGELLMEYCTSSIIDGKEEALSFKNADDIEEYFKYGLIKYTELVGEILGLVIKNFNGINTTSTSKGTD